MSPPPRRRSARLAGAAVKSKAVPELSSVVERDETPTRIPSKKTIEVAALGSPRPTPATPASSTMKPPHSEMHPSKVHPTMGEPSSALRLGFSDIKHAGRRDSQRGSGLDSTPSKIGVPSASFTFRVARQAADTELSTSAQRMMDELREEAAKIKADLVAQREAEQSNVSDRTFAKPKGKSGRFSAAHMAEFKKMDSIEGHASAWRAQNGRFTPVKSSLKRTPSKANLDATPTPHKSNSKQSPEKAGPEETPNARPKPSLKRTSSVANLDNRPPSPKKAEIGTTPNKNRTPSKEEISFPAKRLRQRVEDDASTTRPVSRDGSSIPRPMFSAKKPGTATPMRPGLSRLMSPTKSSMAHVASGAKPAASLVAPSPKPSIGNLSKSATTESVASATKALDLKRRIISPNRFQKVKSILRGQKSDSDEAKSAIPGPVAFQAQTPAPPRVDKALPPVPLTTPRRKLTKHVTFTPETTRVAAAAIAQNSPSPHKSGAAGNTKPIFNLDTKNYAGIDSILAKAKSDDVVYPDLSSFKHLIESDTKGVKSPSPSVPGTFTFRSDHTIQFGSTSPSGFGASPGQSSVRHVRASIKAASDMPGSFPDPTSPSTHPNKENAVPSPPKLLFGAPHGMSNKKRHRATSDDDDSDKEAAERAGKKRKNEHMVTRPLGSTPTGIKRVQLDRAPAQTPSRTPGRTPGPVGTATPSKKRPMLSMSRLNMLARPKNRA